MHRGCCCNRIGQPVGYELTRGKCNTLHVHEFRSKLRTCSMMRILRARVGVPCAARVDVQSYLHED